MRKALEVPALDGDDLGLVTTLIREIGKDHLRSRPGFREIGGWVVDVYRGLPYLMVHDTSRTEIPLPSLTNPEPHTGDIISYQNVA